jgi:PAS domain-containing protein
MQATMFETPPQFHISYDKIAATLAGLATGLIGSLKLFRVCRRKWLAYRDAAKNAQDMRERMLVKLNEIAEQQAEQAMTIQLVYAAQGMPLILVGVAAWRSSPDGQCQFVTPGLSELLGLDYHDALGWGWLGGIHPADRERVRLEYVDCCLTRRIFSAYYRYRHEDGQVIYIHGQAYPVLDARTNKVVEFWGRARAIQQDEYLAKMDN